jgi:predicted NBD/HSP70 family sugar kinase
MSVKKINLHSAGRATHQALRDTNEVLVLNIVRERQPVSRVDVAGLTGLEGSTVSKIVARLIDNEFVYEEGVGVASPNGGRKKRFLHLNPEKAYAIGVDLGIHQSTVGLSNFSGRILSSVLISHDRDPLATTRSLAAGIKKMAQACPHQDRIKGVGVSLIGLVDANEGRVLAAEGLSWDDVPLGSLLRQALNLDLPLYFENGARLAALAEIWFGKHVSQQSLNLVFLDIGEGVGAGIVIRGQLYHGNLNGAGEFGHISIDPNGPACSCSGRGCLEVFTRDQATVQRYLELRKSRNKTETNELETEVATEVVIEEIVARCLQGEPEAMEALRQTAGYLGRGLIPVIYSINPEIIVLGGTITKAWDIIYPEIRRVLATQVTRFYASHVSITASTLEERPSLIGAVALVLARAFSLPNLGW